MSWLSQFFLNPGFVLPGAALASVPVIIHLLSRLRYKRVRFAAMEFLLQSDELNRRRLIIEQLLLLLLRVLAVILIVLLLARLVLDPSRMLLMRGATTHHVLILDDSLSMREWVDDRLVFDHAVATLERMLSQGGGARGGLRVTVLTMTEPDRPLATDRTLDNTLLQELTPRLRNLRCSFRSVSPVASLEAAMNVLSGDGSVAPRVHVVTDLRKSDWVSRPEVSSALTTLKSIDAEVSLIQVTGSSADNVVLKDLSADKLGVAVGSPWRMHLVFQNFGTAKATGLRATVLVDGIALPVNVLVSDIEPRGETVVSHDITFDSPGQHEVEVRLEDDALLDDNRRFLVTEVTDKRTILLVDDDGQQQDAGYVSAALTSDPGLAVEQRSSDVLTTSDLTNYDCIYLLNIRDLPADATQLLADYVAAGGGIVWFPGDQANTTWYESLWNSSDKLFPVPLGTVQSLTEEIKTGDAEFQSPVFEQHPIFMIYNLPDSPFADTIQVSKWFQTTGEWKTDDAERNDGVRTLARLKNGSPVIFEHQHGDGRILTFLTSAGRRWSNWPAAPPAYVVTNLLIHQYLQKPSHAVEVRELSADLKFSWPVSEFTETIEIFLPAGDDESESDDPGFLRLQASPQLPPAASPETSRRDHSAERLSVSVPQASRPGVYRLKRFRVDGDSLETWLALNVPITESDLTVATVRDIEKQDGLGHVHVVARDVASGLQSSDAGREMRWFLLGCVLLVLVCEQLLSLRMSFHPEVKT